MADTVQRYYIDEDGSPLPYAGEGGGGSYTLPPAGLTTLGGVKRNTGSAGQFVTGIASDGSLERDTPAGGSSLGTTSVAYAATVTPNADTTGNLVIGALTGNLTVANPTGTPGECQELTMRVTQDGTGGRTVVFGSDFRLPTGGAIDIATAAGKTTYIKAKWHDVDGKWDITGNLGGYGA